MHAFRIYLFIHPYVCYNAYELLLLLLMMAVLEISAGKLSKPCGEQG